MRELIDKEELIGSIQYLFDGLATSWVEASERIIEIIREEPSVPQKEFTEQNVRDAFNSGYSCAKDEEWILYEEERPVDDEPILASVRWDNYGDYTIAVGHINRFDQWTLYSPTEGELLKNFTVIAWMPLPKPYTADTPQTDRMCDADCNEDCIECAEETKAWQTDCGWK